MKPPNPIDVVELAYRLDGTDREWLLEIARAVSPLLEGGLGMMAYQYDVATPPEAWFDAAHWLDMPEAAVAFTARFIASTQRSEIQRAHVAPSPFDTLRSVSARIGLNVPTQLLADAGIRDVVALRTVEPGPRGLMMCALLREHRVVDRRTRALWSRVSAHLAAGRRLREHLGGAPEAVLSPSGKLLHAEGELVSRSAREALRTAVEREERARGRMRREDPHGATEMWTALVGGRWSLVDQFERGGRRYVVARRNEVGCTDPRTLGHRERAIAHLAALGKSNKLIAYELGIAESTVATHLASAMRKLGVRSRLRLVRVLASLNPAR